MIKEKKPPQGGFFLMRWGGLEPPRLAAHGPQPCLSANSSTSAGRSYYNQVALNVKRQFHNRLDDTLTT